MERYQIKIDLLGRTFPMMVNQAEEASIRLAKQLIEDKLALYRDKFNIRDEPFLVLMCCLDIANEYVKSEHEHQQGRSQLQQQLEVINELIDSSMSALQAQL